MKKYFILLVSCVLIGISCKSSADLVEIEANGQKIYNQLPPKTYDFKLFNKSSDDLEVTVVNRETRDFVSGFGLSGNAELTVAATDELVIKNDSNQSAKVVVSYIENPMLKSKPAKVRYIGFTLRNSSSKSIPLIIPGVMNPNLSSDSNSGVTLKMGQKVYFKKGFKKYLLLEVDDSIKDGDKLDVAKLLKERKKELDL